MSHVWISAWSEGLWRDGLCRGVVRPCEYRRPRVMTVHAALVAQKLQRLAHGLPHVLCGDFNFGPTWPQYQMITTGSMPADDPAWPLLPESDNWEPRLDTPLRSAIKEKHGQEPEFTCYAFQSKVRVCMAAE